MYKKKLYNLETKKFPKIASNSSQNPHLRLKWGWHKDAQAWLNYWRVNEEFILENRDNIKNTVTSKFKDKLWDDKELEGKMKLRYYKEVINHSLANKIFFLS